MARPRTPSALKVVTGRKGRVGINPQEPKPKGAIGRAPAWMSDAQRRIWDETVAEAPAGVLTAVDRRIFTAFVVASEAHQSAALLVAERGTTIETKQGNVIQAPWVGMLNRQALILIRTASELGFTPASRSKVSIEPEGPGDEDPAAKYFQ